MRCGLRFSLGPTFCLVFFTDSIGLACCIVICVFLSLLRLSSFCRSVSSICRPSSCHVGLRSSVVLGFSRSPEVPLGLDYGSWMLHERAEEEMPLVESVAAGPSPGRLPFCSVTSSRKEKKKQAKEERDRLKQAEKKNRRLEKALATAAAIRTELEKKKQRRKEEEQRLDEEGAALAEAVALQVLVDEDTNGVASFMVPTVVEMKTNSENFEENGFAYSCLGTRRRDTIQHNGLKRPGSFTYSLNAECSHRATFDSEMDCNSYDWGRGSRRAVPTGRYDTGAGSSERILQEEEGAWETYSRTEGKARARKDRAKAAQIAAQAVAALRTAEEARAEAEAAKKAAEAAIKEAFDGSDSKLNPGLLDESKGQRQSVEMERGALRARLEETERKLEEKILRVAELEHNLEEVTQYFMEFKAMTDVSKSATLEI